VSISRKRNAFHVEQLKVEDHDALWRLWNHPEIVPKRGKGTEAPFLEFATWLANRVLFPKKHIIHGLKFYNHFIGCLNYDRFEDSIDVHILIHPAYHRCGFGPYAITRTLRYVWEEWGRLEVFAGIVKGNEPAIKMFKKLGFEYRGENSFGNGREIVAYSRKP
jgi:RimJ/RimL family protein N-acetyltransferase